LAVYARAEGIARERGIILADTKFEFGQRPDGTIVLADEVLTPDSSRFWDAATWEPGGRLDSYDKQFVRNWLAARVGLGPGLGRRAAATADRDRRRHPRKVCRGVRANHRGPVRASLDSTPWHE
jgi:phosphoribosylaminoimidazole-succinocarboxamide synthase